MDLAVGSLGASSAEAPRKGPRTQLLRHDWSIAQRFHCVAQSEDLHVKMKGSWHHAQHPRCL